MGRDEFRKRLESFYAVYNPSCLSSVDPLLDTYRGREEDIFRVLVDKYGPEPLQPTPEELSTDNRLQGVGPKAEFRGRDSPLQFRSLQHHYQREKTVDDPPESAKHTEREIGRTSVIASKFGNNTKGKQGFNLDEPSGSSQRERLRKKLIDFYQKRNSLMVSFVDDLIDNYNGNEEEMFRDLDNQYGVKNMVTQPALVPPETDVHSVIKQLSAALEVKTAETLALKNDREQLARSLAASNKLLDELRERERLLETQLHATEQQLQEERMSAKMQVRDTENIALRKEKANLSAELTASNKLLDELREREGLLKKCLLIAEEKLHLGETSLIDMTRRKAEVDHGKELFFQEKTSTNEVSPGAHVSLPTLEHRIRVLEVEKQQLLDELQEAEKRAFEVSDLLSIEHKRNISLLEELGCLKLAVEQPATEAAFALIVKDIETRFSSHYETELERYRREMKEYYVYAENQLRRRDALIAALGANRPLPQYDSIP